MSVWLIKNNNWEGNTSFCEDAPRIQVVWDSTTLGTFKTCPRKYYYEYIEGFRSKRGEIHLEFGVYYHASLEKYDIFLTQGMTQEEALKATIRYIHSLKWESYPEHKDYKLKNKYTLLRAVTWYIEHFKDDALETVILKNGKPAVELSFQFSLNNYLTYAGHIDRLVKFGDDIYVSDRKTSKSALSTYYYSQFNPSNQMTGYAVAGSIITSGFVRGVIIDSCQLGVNFARFGRHITTRTERQLEEWITNTITVIEQAHDCVEADYFPMNENSCGNYGGCPFRDVCGACPSMRDSLLKSNFTRVGWNPASSR